MAVCLRSLLAHPPPRQSPLHLRRHLEGPQTPLGGQCMSTLVGSVIPIFQGEVTDENAETFAGKALFSPQSKIQNRESVLDTD